MSSIRQVPFGKLGFKVSRLVVGTGSSGNGGDSVQGQQAIERYSKVLQQAYRQGARFWDTALMYGTHTHLAHALKFCSRHEVVISSKTLSREREQTLSDLDRTLDELETEYIDIFLMHQVDDLEEWEQVQESLQALGVEKRRARVRAVGISTHNIDVLERACVSPQIDTLFTNFNFANEHMDADIKDYRLALQKAYDLGKGIFVHKTLGAGKLVHEYERAVRYNLEQPFLHAVSLGIVDLDQLKTAVESFEHWDRVEG